MAYGQRPSSYFHELVDDDQVAYEVDLACLMVGREIEERIRKKKPVIWDDAGEIKPRGFSTLKGRARKVHIPENGIW